MRPITFVIWLFALASCFEPDEPVLPYPTEITTIYDSVQVYQSWFNLESGAVISVNRIDEWTMAFESEPDGWRIMINSGADWFIYNTGSPVITDNPVMPSQLNGLYDIQALWPDSGATGNWPLQKNTFLLARYLNGIFTEHKQIRFLNYTESSYDFLLSDSSGSDTITIPKDQTRNFSYYSVDKRSQVYPEPPKEEYDLIFTSYYDLATLFGQTIPYKVGGVLLNTYNTSAAIDTVHLFEEINAAVIAQLEFLPARDVPGYNWKNVVVDITGGGSANYTVKTNYNYVIRTLHGKYFRLRFLSYTLDGRSGFPRFEYEEI